MEETEDFELTRACAFTFPGVLATLGVARWVDLHSCYRRLTEVRMNKVKQTLAASVGAIAVQVGGETMKKEMLPLFLGYVNDDTAEVVIAGLASLSSFMRIIAEEDQLEVGRVGARGVCEA